MNFCAGEKCPLRAHCTRYFPIRVVNPDHLPFAPFEIAEGLVSCPDFLFNNKEYVESQSLKEIIMEYLRTLHRVPAHDFPDGKFSQRTMDALLILHIDTRTEHAVFAVYSIFFESDEYDEQTVYARSFVLSPAGKVLTSCALPSHQIPL